MFCQNRTFSPRHDRRETLLREVLFYAIVSLTVLAALLPAAVVRADGPPVYVILWFDTEDYLLPASDDAALRLATLLTDRGVKATFKVVGEKARTLQRRERTDVIAALSKHEIGYHANFHSTQPSPAMYLANLGWDEGVAEFQRREGAGRDDVERIFGQRPSCYGQPGSSWAPQSFGAMQIWQMGVYLDAGRHVQLGGKPHFYCDRLTIYHLDYQLRADLNDASKLGEAQERFQIARKKLQADGGGIISIYYHPCEWVHRKFWDGVNFAAGANPPREQWKLPPQKSAEETETSFAIFENYLRFMQQFDDVRFISASQAGKLYADHSHVNYSREQLKTIAQHVGDAIDFQTLEDRTLSPAEVFYLLAQAVAAQTERPDALAARLDLAPLGPTGRVSMMEKTVTADRSQFARTTQDVLDYIVRQRRIPSTVWLGSKPVSPEAFLRTLAGAATKLLEGGTLPDELEFQPTRLAVAKYVADDDPKLWGWVIFPPNFRAPALMELARQQSWTIKPAVLGKLPD